MKKSIKINILLNFIKTLFSTLFPIITFSYVSRILKVNDIGNYNFYLYMMSFFHLFANLGIQTYAICEGSSKRENSNELNKFANQIYSINLSSGLISLTALFTITACIGKFRENWLLIVIVSLIMISDVIGTEWIFTVYEDYTFITIRYIFAQFITTILTFIFIKNENDYLNYALISSLPAVISSLLNCICRRKYCRLKFTFLMDLKVHMYSIFTIFLSNAATSVYLNADITMLGIISGEKFVGLYTITVKIYNIIKNVASASVVVTVPRLKMLLAEGEFRQHKLLISKLYSGLILLVFPISMGLCSLSEECVLLVGGNSYLMSSNTLKILSAAMIFAVLNCLTTMAILFPLKKEKIVLKGTVISALLNVVLNFILLKRYNQNGAAFTTLISEFSLFCFTLYYSKKYIDFKTVFNNMKIALLSIPIIFITTIIVKNVCENIISRSIFSILISAVLYLILMLLSNNVLRETITNFRRSRQKVSK